MDTDSSIRNFIKPFKQQKFGFSVEDATQIKWTKLVESLVVLSIEKGDPVEISLSLVVIEGCALNESLCGANRENIINRLWEHVAKHDQRLGSQILRTTRLVSPQSVEANFSELDRCLGAAHPLLRLEALIASTPVCERHLQKILLLQYDDYFSEVNIAGRMEFIIRNEAFAILSSRFGAVEKIELSETVGNEIVYFWDWNPLLAIVP